MAVEPERSLSASPAIGFVAREELDFTLAAIVDDTDRLPFVTLASRRDLDLATTPLGRLGLTWSCNAKANVPGEILAVLADHGLRLLVVGYEPGNQQVLDNVKKGLEVDRARRFAMGCRDLWITVHGTFILGLPGETKETTQETIRFAREVNPHTIQVSVAARR